MNKKKFNELIANFDFVTLFVNELGWNNFAANHPILLPKIDTTFTITGIAEKKDFPILLCSSSNGKIPEYGVRKQIGRLVSKNQYFDHLIIFIDKHKTAQIWQLPLKEEGKPSRIIQINWYKNQDAENLYQRLRNIVFTLDEEDIVTLADVKARVNSSLSANSDKNIKEFYNEFKNQHKAFLSYIKGIDDKVLDDKNIDKKWYASLMLNRLMFCYFIQKRKFLDWNDKYLTDKLAECKKFAGKNSFYGFYRSFLLELFHNELSNPEEKRKKSTCPVPFGKIPYLNGGLFDVHGLENEYKGITIKDEIFDKIFAFFDKFEWHLDAREQSSGRDINPDVIGFVFEKYINDRASMGAYYTKEDITDYIGKNTIIPFILEKVKNRYPEPFENGGAFWQYLQASGDDYIYDSIKQGIHEEAKNINEIAIPADIKKGIDTKKPNLLERRKDWNTATPEEFALPTEIWRETIIRFERYFEIKNKIAGGEIRQVNDLITYNLQLKHLLSAVLAPTQDALCIRTLYKVLPTVTILDPTCGSGAFLFAAMNILEPLYEICINRMEEIYNASPSKNDDFKERLGDIQMGNHSNLKYYIFKTIILNNLYGVDLMNEAVEIAKLRLFLKLIAEVDPSRSKKNYGLEPLPDIDFNIKAGNTLVGFASEKQIENAFSGELNFDTDILSQIKQKCGTIAAEFKHFRAIQLGSGYKSAEIHTIKKGLENSFAELNRNLDRYLAKTYGINAEKEKKKFEELKQSHQPFHWFSEFYQIIAENGGFDVVIGNPPYLELRQIDYIIKGLKTIDSSAVHAMCIEKCFQLVNKTGNVSMIVPLALVCTQRMIPVQRIIEENRAVWYSNFAWRPAKLFDTVNRALTIFVANNSIKKICYNTGYMKWNSDNRNFIFGLLSFVSYNETRDSFWSPKLSSKYEKNILHTILKQENNITNYIDISKYKIYYRTTGGLYWKVFTDKPPKFIENGEAGSSSRETSISLKEKTYPRIFVALFSSSLFWWWYTVTSNLRDLNPSDLSGFRFSDDIMKSKSVMELADKYIESLDKNSSMLTRIQRNKGETITQSFKISLSKPIIDKIDYVLAKHYSFTDEELDFIINYDIKYRMGSELDGDAEE